MATAPTPHNLTALLLFIDTHIIDAVDEATVCLRRLRDEGWINLQRTDAMDTELANAPAEKWGQLTEASASYPADCLVTLDPQPSHPRGRVVQAPFRPVRSDPGRGGCSCRARTGRAVDLPTAR